MLNNNANPMLNNMNPNMMMNPMMNNMNPNMMFNPMMNNMNPNMMMNPMMNNMNQMNMIVGDINNLNQQMNKEIKVIIKAENNKFDFVSCFENDNIDTLRNKLNLKYNDYLIYNYRELNPDLTLKENGIINGSIIYIKSNVINIIFKSTQGISNNIVLDEDCPLNMAIAFYGLISKKENFWKKIYEGSIVFLFNATKLYINDETPIKKCFKGIGNPNVIVNDTYNIIGG